MTWLRGRHAFKGGLEVRFDSSNGFNSFYALPGRDHRRGDGVPFVNLNGIAGIGTNLAASAEHVGRPFWRARQLDPGLQLGRRQEPDLHSW